MQRCPVCNEWIGEQGQIRDKPLAPSIWHTIWCRLRDDHAAPSQWADIEGQVGDRRAIAGETVPAQRSRDETALSETSNARAESVNGDDAAVRARLAEKLSDDELALLDNLERERVAYAAQGEVTRADEPESEQPSVSAAALEGAEQQEVGGAPRRRRKKERAVA